MIEVSHSYLLQLILFIIILIILKMCLLNSGHANAVLIIVKKRVRNIFYIK